MQDKGSAIPLMACLEIKLLSSFQVTLNGRSVTDFATDKARALLVYLIVERDRPHRRESLATLLWPEQPEKRARQNLRQALSNLRQALGENEDHPTFLLVERNDLWFNPHAELRLDVAEFVSLAEACAAHRHREPGACLPCIRRLEQMVTLYRGDFLAGFAPTDSTLFEEWMLLKREWLHGQAMDALALLADYAERRGDTTAARRYAQRQVQLEPWREEAHRQLIRLLAQAGQRSAALAQYAACRQALAQELGVSPTRETEQLYQQIRAADVRLVANASPRFLPQAPTPFIGRTAERSAIAALLAAPDCRLLSLAGPGGIGKSRLALQVAEDHLGIYADGIFWVDLSGVQQATQIVPALAQAIGFTLFGQENPLRQLCGYLRERWLLLVLDGAEHLPDLADVLALILQEAPDVTLLVTTRERLALREEWLFAVEGLAYPVEEVNPEELAYLQTAVSTHDAYHEAIAFFQQQVQRLERQFQPNVSDLAAITNICRLVEGMPLALELAAAAVPERGCAAVAQELRSGLNFLTSTLRNAPERQRSMRATFAHSWALLNEPERHSFARLAVFQGSFAPNAARQVAGADQPTLGGLMAKSLLRHSGNGRYQLHTLLQQFAAEQLEALDGAGAYAAARHAAYYADFLASQEAALKGQGQEEALLAIDRDIANVRQAWQWTIAHLSRCPEAGALLHRSMESLYQYYCLRSWYHEGRSVFAQAAAAAKEMVPQDGLLLGQLLARQARCLEFTAPPGEATGLYQESLAILRRLGDAGAAALPLYGLGYMHHIQGKYEAAHQFFNDSLASYTQLHDRWGMATVLSGLCLNLRRQGRFAAARQAGEQSLAMRREIGDRRGIASSQNNLGLVDCALGDYDAADSALQESVAICRAIGHTVGTANAYTGLVQVAMHRSDHEAARRFQAEALQLFQDVGDLWGVAVAYNNLGYISMASGNQHQARGLFDQAVATYRRVNVQAGLANALSNLGQACFLQGDAATAARTFGEALEISLAIGDRPIVLEILARTAVLWQQQVETLDPLVLLYFALAQPEMLDYSRQAAMEAVSALQARFAGDGAAAALAAAIAEAAHLDTAAAAAIARQALQEIAVANGHPNATLPR